MYFLWAPISTSSRDGLLHPQIISIWCGFIRGVCLMYGALLPWALRVIDMAFWLLVKERVQWRK